MSNFRCYGNIRIQEPKQRKKDISDWRFCLKPGDLISLPVNSGTGDLTPVICMVISFKHGRLIGWALKPIYTGQSETEFEQYKWA